MFSEFAAIFNDLKTRSNLKGLLITLIIIFRGKRMLIEKKFIEDYNNNSTIILFVSFCLNRNHPCYCYGRNSARRS